MNNTIWIDLLSLNVANDNDPTWRTYDRRDYEDFDPSELPYDILWDDDTIENVYTFITSHYA